MNNHRGYNQGTSFHQNVVEMVEHPIAGYLRHQHTIVADLVSC